MKILLMAIPWMAVSVPFQWLSDVPFGSYVPGLTLVDSLVVWYPAADKAPARSITIEGYFDLLDGTEHTGSWMNVATRVSGNTMDSVTARRLAQLSMRAVRDTEPTSGRFPVVLWAARHETHLYQCLMSEFLASHGYVVVFPCRTVVPPWKISKDNKTLEFDLVIKQWSQALLDAKRLRYADSNRIGIMAWSYAGESAEALQMTFPEVNLVLSLSSNVLEDGVYFGPLTRSQRRLDRMRPPYVLMSERVAPNGRPRRVPAILDSLSGPGYYLFFDSLSHGNFNFLEGYLPAANGVLQVQPWARPGKEAREGYVSVMKYTVEFLNHFVREKMTKRLDPSMDSRVEIRSIVPLRKE